MAFGKEEKAKAKAAGKVLVTVSMNGTGCPGFPHKAYERTAYLTDADARKFLGDSEATFNKADGPATTR